MRVFFFLPFLHNCELIRPPEVFKAGSESLFIYKIKLDSPASLIVTFDRFSALVLQKSWAPVKTVPTSSNGTAGKAASCQSRSYSRFWVPYYMPVSTIILCFGSLIFRHLVCRHLTYRHLTCEICSDESLLQHALHCLGFLEWRPENNPSSFSGEK